MMRRFDSIMLKLKVAPATAIVSGITNCLHGLTAARLSFLTVTLMVFGVLTGLSPAGELSPAVEKWKKAQKPITDTVKGYLDKRPFASGYFGDAQAYNFKTYFGPLGMAGYVNDSAFDYPTWITRSPAITKDAFGIWLSNIEVLRVHEEGPCGGLLERGDIIYAIDGQRFRTAADLYADDQMSKRFTRTLLPHIGQLIDAGEGKGEIELSLLRISDSFNPLDIRGTIPVEKEHEVMFDNNGPGIMRLRFFAGKGVGGRKSAQLRILNPVFFGKGKKDRPAKYSLIKGAVGDEKVAYKGEWSDSTGNWRKGKYQSPKYKGRMKLFCYRHYHGSDNAVEVEVVIPDGYSGFKATFVSQSGGWGKRHDWHYSAAKSTVSPNLLSELARHRSGKVVFEDYLSSKTSSLKIDVAIPKEHDKLRVEVVKKTARATIGLLDFELYNSAGKVIPMDELDRLSFISGGRFWPRNYQPGRWVSTEGGRFLFDLPPGKWRFRGRVEWLMESVDRRRGDPGLRVTTMETAKALPASLEKLVKKVTISLPKIGSFGKTLDPEGTKARNYSDMLATRIEMSQNGKNQANLMGLSMMGLGLLATGESRYDDLIRRLAYKAAHSGFGVGSYPHGLQLIFLSEYYLRSKDEGVIPAINIILEDAELRIASDGAIGHGYAPGYGHQGGWVGAASAYACGMAVASKTPAKVNRNTLERILKWAQRVAPSGVIPYGRSVTPYLAGEASVRPGHGYGARSGLFYPAMKIYGYPKKLYTVMTKRYTTLPYGDTDAGHAAQNMHFIFGALAIGNCGDKYLKAHLNTYSWMFTLHRDYTGFISQIPNHLEFHGADGKTTNDPYFVSGGYLLLLNQHKRNLAITGRPDYQAKRFTSTPTRSMLEDGFYRYIYRNLAIVEANLEEQCPQALTQAVEDLVALPAKHPNGLGQAVLDFVESRGPDLARQIAKLNVKSPEKQYYMEMVLGAEHQFEVLDKSKTKDKKYGINLKSYDIYAMWQRGNAGFASTKGSPLKMFPATIELTNPENGQSMCRQTVKPTEYKKDQRAYGTVFSGLMLPDEEWDIVARVKYSIAGIPIAYDHPIGYNKPPEMKSDGRWFNHRKITVKGWCEAGPIFYNRAFRLQTGRIIQAESRKKIYFQGRKSYAMKGDKAVAHITSGDHWGAVMPMLQVSKRSYRSVYPQTCTVTQGTLKQGKLVGLNKTAPPAVLKAGDKQKVVIEMSFDKPYRFSHFEATRTREGYPFVLEAFTAGAWQECGWGRTSTGALDKAFISPVTSNRWRLTLTAPPPSTKKDVTLTSLELFKAFEDYEKWR